MRSRRSLISLSRASAVAMVPILAGLWCMGVMLSGKVVC